MIKISGLRTALSEKQATINSASTLTVYQLTATTLKIGSDNVATLIGNKQDKLNNGSETINVGTLHAGTIKINTVNIYTLMIETQDEARNTESNLSSYVSRTDNRIDNIESDITALKSRATILEANAFPHYGFRVSLGTIGNRLYSASNSNTDLRTIQFSVREFDYGYFFNTTYYKYVVPVKGIYQLTCSVNIVSPISTSIKFFVAIEKVNPLGGSPVVIGQNIGTAPINNFVTCMADLDAGDEVYCTINSETANSIVTISQGGAVSYFSGFLYTPVSLTSTAPVF